jgi:hypothetical protein
VFAVQVRGASAMGKPEVVAPYAAYVLYARLAQSIVHVIGVNHWLVLVRLTFWSVQVALFAFMFWQFSCDG